MNETYCGVCNNENPNCLTCHNTRTWEARQIDGWLDNLFKVSYTGGTEEERLEEWKKWQLSG